MVKNQYFRVIYFTTYLDSLLPCAATVFKANPLDPASGKLYRDKILLPGGSREEIDSLKVRHTYILIILT